MGLHLGQVEVRAGAAGQQPRRAVEEVQAEVEQRARDGLAVDQQVAFGQVPAARAHQQRRRILAQLVVAAVGAVVGDRALDRVAQVDVALDHVAPGRGVGVLEVGHEAVGARVQRVDDHLALGRAGDLDPALLQIGRSRGDLPVALADLGGVLEEVQRRRRRAARRGARRARSSSSARRGPNSACSSATNSSASGVSTASKAREVSPRSSRFRRHVAYPVAVTRSRSPLHRPVKRVALTMSSLSDPEVAACSSRPTTRSSRR